MPIPDEILARDDVYYKIPHLTYNEARSRFDAIVRRNGTVLAGLVCADALEMAWYRGDPERIFSQEWGLARDEFYSNSECFLISGGNGTVQWAPFLAAKMVPLAHSHPYHERIATSRALPAAGVPWDRISGAAAPQNLHARLLVFPSQGDVEFCAAANLAAHVVYTPYCVTTPIAGITIVNPNAPGIGPATPRLRFRLEGVRWVNSGHYLVDLVALANATVFWRKRGVRILGGGATGIVL